MFVPSLTRSRVRLKRVLVRAGIDVPVNARGRVLDRFRIERLVPTLHWLLGHGASVILIGHRGQPHGRRRALLSLKPVVPVLQKLLRCPVRFSAIPPKRLRAEAGTLAPGNVLLLENLRFDPREEKKNMSLARELAALADFYVNEDFSTSHRDHTSFTLLPRLLPHAAGFNLLEELAILGRLLHRPRRPFMILVGGAKVSDKLGVVEHLLPRVDNVLVGGVAATTLLAAKGIRVGRSLIDRDVPRSTLRALLASRKVILPRDVIAVHGSTSRPSAVASEKLLNSAMAMDLGPATVAEFAGILRRARTVFWAGSLGRTEVPAYRRSTRFLAEALSPARMFSVVGGGDTLNALHALHVTRRFAFLSTGGGATLTFLAQEPMPGLEALKR